MDPASNFLAIHDQRPASAVPDGDARRNTQFLCYDNLYRLTRVQYSFQLPGDAARNDGEIQYRYDRIGNMLSQTSTMGEQEQTRPVTDLGDLHSGGAAGRWNRVGRAAHDPPGPHALTSIHSPTAQNQDRELSYDANRGFRVRHPRCSLRL